MAFKLPVLSRTRKKEDVESWVGKTSTAVEAAAAAAAAAAAVPKPRTLKFKQPRHLEENVKNEAVPTKPQLVLQPQESQESKDGYGNSESDSDDVLKSVQEDEEDDEEETEEEEVTSPALKTYSRAAKRLGVTPLRKVMSELGKERMSFRNLTLTTRDMKALCTALLRECDVVEMDFSGNYISGRECDYLTCVLSRADYMETLDVSNNCLSGRALRSLSACICECDNLTVLDISGNKLIDSDSQAVASFLTTNNNLRTLVMNHNEFRETGGRLIGGAIGKNKCLEELELRWNHLRRDGAIGMAKGLEENKSLKRVDLAWNGFGFEGCVALSDALGRNYTLEDLDISSNRINPPALMELVRGLARNKALKALRIGQNPITASFTCVLLNTIRQNPTMALDNLDMEGIVVDNEFQTILADIRRSRTLHVNYDLILPVKAISREGMTNSSSAPDAYNIDPLHMFYLLKKKMRASDFFYKINKDHDGGVTRDELFILFKDAGIPVTGSVVDSIVEFMDSDGDGTIDLAEFMSGDKKIKKFSRQAKQTKDKKKRTSKDDGYKKYTRTFKKTESDPVNLSVKVLKPTESVTPNNSENVSPEQR